MGFLVVLLLLVYIYSPDDAAARGCSGFRHLENGRTFFRYSGLLVMFRCHPGYKLHGYKTSSCVSGNWSREPPVCVGSGCPQPGPLTHGTSSMTEDGSWAEFSCISGFRLHGPSMLYCKGHNWNSTKPVCKELDMMSSLSGVTAQKAASVLKTLQQSHYPSVIHTASKDAHLKSGLALLHTPSQTQYDGERIKVTNQKVSLQDRGFKVRGAARHEEADDGMNSAEGTKMEATLTTPAEANPSPAAPPTSFSATERPISLPLLFPTVHTPVFPTRISFREPVTVQELMAPPAGTVVQYPSSSTALDTEEPWASTSSPSVDPTSHHPSIPSSPLSESLSSPPGSTPSSTIQSQFPDLTIQSHISTNTSRAGAHNLPTLTTSGLTLLVLRFGRRPVCPYPPVPAHGTFYFRNVENPGPREFRHYIQYACYPGYTLAHGDVHSYCQQGAVWSGVTPVCLELTPCSVNNGGCSQLCSHSRYNNRSSDQDHGRAQCGCRPGFTLLDDGRTCRDVDECADGQHRCHQSCINTFGSFKCGCGDGYQAAHDQTTCIDIDECAVNGGVGPCMDQCHNTAGSYRCSCRYGHVLAEDGHSCIPECPPGYRKEPTTPGTNTTTHTLQEEECVDVNECEQQRCEWQCVNLPGSHHCICPRGYTLHRDGKRCKDINECSGRNGGCSHLCVNQRGGYKCACPSSHRLSPHSWKKCVPRRTATTAG